MPDFETEPAPQLNTGDYDFLPDPELPPQPQPEMSKSDQEPPRDDDAELTEEEKDDFLRKTYELRSMVGDDPVGIFPDEDWDRMVEKALDEAGYEKPAEEAAPEEPQ